MNIADEQAAAVNVTWQQQGRAHNHLLDVHVATILSRWDRSQTLGSVRATSATYGSWLRSGRLRRQSNAARCAELRFARQPRPHFRLARQSPNGAHKRIHGNTQPGNLIRDGLEPVDFPVGNVRLGVKVAQKTESGDDCSVAIFVGLDVNQRHR